MHIKVCNVSRALALIVIGCCLAGPAAAQDEGWYIGGGLGRIEYPDNGTLRFDEITFAAREDEDGADSSISVWVGYDFNRYFAIELGYIRNDGTELDLINEANELDGRFGFRTGGPTLTFVGALPLGKWEPYARVGLLYADTEVYVSETDGAVLYRAEANGFEFITAVGLGYNFTPQWQAKVDVAYAVNVGEPIGTGEANISVVTVGLTYRF